MGGKPVLVHLTTAEPVKIKKWKVKQGILVSAGKVIFLYNNLSNLNSKELLKFKCFQVGTAKRLLAKEGDIIRPGESLLELEECTHPTVMKDMCAECGADLRKEEKIAINASVPMVHSIPELKVSIEQAQTIGKEDERRLLNDKKLVLLVDLDQTLIHTTNDNIPPNLKDVYHFQLYGPHSPWYHTRIRPKTQSFLQEISKYYELHICTFGARNYAHMIAMFLDPDGKYFSHRILSRDECFNANSKTANLKALFPCGDNLVCIIDDREDVWNYSSNLIHVKPYHFFQHTGDINAPPGLTKKENDEAGGYDFAKLDTEGNEKKEKKKTDTLGETTTDKDTEDEEEKKLLKTKGDKEKTNSMEQQQENILEKKSHGTNVEKAGNLDGGKVTINVENSMNVDQEKIINIGEEKMTVKAENLINVVEEKTNKTEEEKVTIADKEGLSVIEKEKSNIEEENPMNVDEEKEIIADKEGLSVIEKEKSTIEEENPMNVDEEKVTIADKEGLSVIEKEKSTIEEENPMNVDEEKEIIVDKNSVINIGQEKVISEENSMHVDKEKVIVADKKEAINIEDEKVTISEHSMHVDEDKVIVDKKEAINIEEEKVTTSEEHSMIVDNEEVPNSEVKRLLTAEKNSNEDSEETAKNNEVESVTMADKHLMTLDDEKSMSADEEKAADLEKVTGDLELSDDDSMDTQKEDLGNSENQTLSIENGTKIDDSTNKTSTSSLIDLSSIDNPEGIDRKNCLPDVKDSNNIQASEAAPLLGFTESCEFLPENSSNKPQTDVTTCEIEKSAVEEVSKDSPKEPEKGETKVIKENGVSGDKDKKQLEGVDTKENILKKSNGADTVAQKSEDDLIEVEDNDDYLLYLEDILKNIHKTFYNLYNKKQNEIPDLKEVVPNVKKNTLSACNIVFSGIIPSHVKLEISRPYLVAVSLGATVTTDLTQSTTHLVAARPGTAKVNSARRQKGIITVTPLWLWHCAERWEKVDERLYPLGRGGVANRHPPAHCGSPEHNSTPPHQPDYTPTLRNRTPSGRFIDTINPLLTFSSEDIKNMDQEVEDMFNDEDESESEIERKKARSRILKSPITEGNGQDSSSSSSSTYSLSGVSHPRGWEEPSLKKARKRAAETTTCTESELDEEFPSVKFRRGEPLPSDLDLCDESQDSGRSEGIDNVDDGDWNMMGAALEREFLSNN